VFKRPDAIAMIPPKLRAGNVIESDDLCALRAQDATQVDRYFVRCTLAVPLVDHDGVVTHWGVWAEVSGHDSKVIYDRWDDPAQMKQPAMDALLANNIRGYPATIGLRLRLRMAGPTTRPSVVFAAKQSHQFARECRAGVTIDRLKEWLGGMGVV
jgi:hypothetical protein